MSDTKPQKQKSPIIRYVAANDESYVPAVRQNKPVFGNKIGPDDLPILITDFDGILSSPWSLHTKKGRALKAMSVNDSIVIKHLLGYLFSKVVILTSGGTGYGFEITRTRVKEIFGSLPNVYLVKCDSIHKAGMIETFFDQEESLVYLGDDITDISVFQIENIGWGAIPSSAPRLLADNVPSYVFKSKKDGSSSFFTDAIYEYSKAVFGPDTLADIIDSIVSVETDLTITIEQI